MAESVEIVEVGPRDGLQNHGSVVDPEVRAELVRRLLEAGVDLVEAVAFVSANRVPQMAGADAVVAGIPAEWSQCLTALVPNLHGFERAFHAGLRQVRCVIATSDQMNQANFGVSTERTLDGIRSIADAARSVGMGFGVVIGTAFGCPYEGEIPMRKVISIARRAAHWGADEIVLADTTGVAHPGQVYELCELIVREDLPRPAVHLHNTRNIGYANALRALDAGIRRFDASLGGLGGCPFAPGASGNVATEELVYMFEADGLEVRPNLEALLTTASWLSDQLNVQLPSQLLRAGATTKTKEPV